MDEKPEGIGAPQTVIKSAAVAATEASFIGNDQQCKFAAVIQKRKIFQSYKTLVLCKDFSIFLSSYLSQTLLDTFSLSTPLDSTLSTFASEILSKFSSDEAETHACAVMNGLHTFYLEKQALKHANAISTLDTLSIFPLQQDLASVEEKTRAYLNADMVAVIGGVCLAYMECLLSCWKSGIRDEVRNRAAALILFSSGINVRKHQLG
jgi:hypothetical protein